MKPIEYQNNHELKQKMNTLSSYLHLSSMKLRKYHHEYPSVLLKNAIEEWRELWAISKKQRRIKSLERIKQNGSRASN